MEQFKLIAKRFWWASAIKYWISNRVHFRFNRNEQRLQSNASNGNKYPDRARPQTIAIWKTQFMKLIRNQISVRSLLDSTNTQLTI